MTEEEATLHALTLAKTTEPMDRTTTEAAAVVLLEMLQDIVRKADELCTK